MTEDRAALVKRVPGQLRGRSIDFVEQGEGTLEVVTCFHQPPYAEQRDAHDPMRGGPGLRVSYRLCESNKLLGQLQLLCATADNMEAPMPDENWKKALRIAQAQAQLARPGESAASLPRCEAAQIDERAAKRGLQVQLHPVT